MEFQPNQPRDFPSWVVLDQTLRYEDPLSFRADDETFAEARATTGELIRVAFTLHPLPGTSCLRISCPKDRPQCLQHIIMAAHCDAVLFRVVFDFAGLPALRCYAVDHFLYRANDPSGPKLSLLPRCCSTEDESMDAAASRDKWRMVESETVGLLTSGEDFVVAELEFNWAVDSDAPLEAELFRLRSRSPQSQGEASGGEWELLLARSRDCDSKVSFRDVLWWVTHIVVPFSSYLCWVDYRRGLLLCDVYQKSPDLQYVRLPVDDEPPSGPDAYGVPSPVQYRTVCVTKGEIMMFITVNSITDTCICKRDYSFTMIVSRLNEKAYSSWEFEESFRIGADELRAMLMNAYDHDHFFCLVPQFPLVSMDDPDILYFVLTYRPSRSNIDKKTWIVTLNMASKTILRCDAIGSYPSDGDAGMASENILRNKGFFPSEFSDYLKKRAPRCTGVFEKEKKTKKVKKKYTC